MPTIRFFIGHNSEDIPCTATSLDVELITSVEYEDPEMENERSAFRDGKMEFYRLNKDASGLARNFGGHSEKRGFYIHNRMFTVSETANIAEHLHLLSTGNTGEKYTKLKLPAGTRIAIGYIANGRGMQARVSAADKDKIEFY